MGGAAPVFGLLGLYEVARDGLDSYKTGVGLIEHRLHGNELDDRTVKFCGSDLLMDNAPPKLLGGLALRDTPSAPSRNDGGSGQ